MVTFFDTLLHFRAGHVLAAEYRIAAESHWLHDSGFSIHLFTVILFSPAPAFFLSDWNQLTPWHHVVFQHLSVWTRHVDFLRISGAVFLVSTNRLMAKKTSAHFDGVL